VWTARFARRRGERGCMLRVIVIRHAIAEDREAFAASGRPDEERPLTDAGARKMVRVARGLARIAGGVDRIGTSPLTRADQTARIVAKALDAPVVTAPALADDGRPDTLDRWLTEQEGVETVAVVGHEPDLGAWVARALHGDGAAPIPLRKGGACLLAFPDGVGPGRGALAWFLPPRVLRRLA
jgi:phosphohistidine phosphatase